MMSNAGIFRDRKGLVFSRLFRQTLISVEISKTHAWSGDIPEHKMADIKIGNIGTGRGPASTGKTRKTSVKSSSFSEKLKETAETSEAGAAGGVAGVSPVSAILSVQEVPDSTEERSRGLMIAYGDELLERLENIRIGLLIGSIPKNSLPNLLTACVKRNNRSMIQSLLRLLTR